MLGQTPPSSERPHDFSEAREHVDKSSSDVKANTPLVATLWKPLRNVAMPKTFVADENGSGRLIRCQRRQHLKSQNQKTGRTLSPSLSNFKIRWQNPNLVKNGRQGQPEARVDVHDDDDLGLPIGLQCIYDIVRRLVTRTEIMD